MCAAAFTMCFYNRGRLPGTVVQSCPLNVFFTALSVLHENAKVTSHCEAKLKVVDDMLKEIR